MATNSAEVGAEAELNSAGHDTRGDQVARVRSPEGEYPRWEDVSLVALTAGYVECPPDWRLPERTRPHYQLWLICGGSVTFTIDGRDSTTLTDGSALLLSPGLRQRADHQPESPLCCYVVHFMGRIYGMPATSLWQPHAMTAIPERGWRFIQHAANELSKELVERRYGSQLLANAAVTRIMGLLQKYTCQAQVEPLSYDCRGIAAASATLDYIRDHYADEISLNQLARAAALSPQHLSQVFHRSVGLSPFQYLRRYRLDRAKQLLGETDLTVTQVAAAVGYPDAYYFSRAFQRSEGLAPSHYRRAMQLNGLSSHPRNLEYDSA
jgi:AraC-like DNA-binding protein/quercetin dioxygenase-like cupin family protein